MLPDLMAKILHVCSTFDPVADVVRCVKELRRFSKHEHRLLIHDSNPCQSALQLEEWPNNPNPISEFEWADAVIFQFTGWEKGWGIKPQKPCAFRNICIYYNGGQALALVPSHCGVGKFFTDYEYSAQNLSHYKLLASSHVGARDFMPGCRFLPDLIPIDEYTPDWTDRPPCVSYIKHGAVLDQQSFGEANKLHFPIYSSPHKEVLSRRQHEATCVIDNICDGHYGLAGLEAMSMGLVTLVFNHPTTRQALKDMAPEYPPFVEIAPSLTILVDTARVVCGDMDIRRESRRWMEKYYHSQRIIDMYWEPFVEELLG